MEEGNDACCVAAPPFYRPRLVRATNPGVVRAQLRRQVLILIRQFLFKGRIWLGHMRYSHERVNSSIQSRLIAIWE